MPTGQNPTYISSVGITPTRVVDQPRYRLHTTRPTKPAGLDWSALAPTCTSCSTRSSTVDTSTGLCPTCTAPAPTEAPAAAPTAPAPARARRRSAVTTAKVDRPKPAKTKAPTPPTPPREPKTPKPPRLPRGSQVNRTRILELYFDDLLTMDAVARQTGHARGTVRSVIEADPRPMRDDRKRNGPPKHTYPADIIDEARSLYELHNLSIREISSRLSMSARTIARVLAEAGVTIQPSAAAAAMAGKPYKTQHNGAGALKDRLAELGTDSRTVKDWALREGLIEMAAVGLPSRRLVEAWATAQQQTPQHQQQQTAQPDGATAFTFRAQWPVDPDHAPYPQLCEEAAWDIPDLLRAAGATAHGPGEFDLHDSPEGLVLTYQCPAQPAQPTTEPTSTATSQETAA